MAKSKPEDLWMNGMWDEDDNAIVTDLPRYVFLLVITPKHDTFPQREYLAPFESSAIPTYLRTRLFYCRHRNAEAPPPTWFWKRIATPTKLPGRDIVQPKEPATETDEDAK